MSVNLFELTHRLANALGTLSQGYATGGGVNTVTDSLERNEADDHWNKGTLWCIWDAGDAGDAPQGEWGIVDDFDQSTHVISLAKNLTAGVASGDRYGVATSKFPRTVLVSNINAALKDFGVVEYNDLTSIVIASDQTLYDLPIAANFDLREVWINRSSNADRPDSIPVHDWEIRRTAFGTGDRLYIPGRYAAGDIVLLKYMAIHPDLNLTTDILSESVNAELVIKDAAVKCLYWFKEQFGAQDASINEKINYALSERDEERLEDWQHLEPPRASKLLVLSRARSRYPGDRNPT